MEATTSAKMALSRIRPKIHMRALILLLLGAALRATARVIKGEIFADAGDFVFLTDFMFNDDRAWGVHAHTPDVRDRGPRFGSAQRAGASWARCTSQHRWMHPLT